MKQLIIISFLVINTISCKSTEVKQPLPYVDERFELMNIVFKLADIQFYQSNLIKPYSEAIDSYFKPYKNHELVKFASELHVKYNMGGDAVARYAVLLQIKDGKISFLDNVKLDFDSRWQGNDPQVFLQKLNDFYQVANFKQFFNNSQSIYQKAIESYNKGFDDIDFKWFDSYFGKKSNKSNFHIVLNLLDEWNYGPKASFNDGHEDLYAIVGTYLADDSGCPKYEQWSYDVVIHEFAHSYINQLVDQYRNDLSSVYEKFYNFSIDRLNSQGVGSSKLFSYETLVRASEIQYQKTNYDSLEWRKRLYHEQRIGFWWMERLCDLLSSEYETNKDKYPDLRSFMPRIVEVLNTLSPEELSKEFYAKAVNFTKSSISDNDTNVNPTTNTLIFSFDKPMFTGKNSYDFRAGKLGDNSLPEILSAKWSDDYKELILNIKLKSNCDYSIVLPASSFLGAKYEPLSNYYHIQFKTSK